MITSYSEHIKRMASFLKFAAELTPEQINSILAKLHIMVQQDLLKETGPDIGKTPYNVRERNFDKFSDKPLTLTSKGLESAAKIFSFLNIKESKVNLSDILGMFDEALRSASKENPEIKNLHTELKGTVLRNPGAIKNLADIDKELKRAINAPTLMKMMKASI